MVSRFKSECLIVALAIAVLGSVWQSCAAADESASCRTFVQSFYNWYIAKGKSSNGMAEEMALKARGDAFSPELRKGLKEDLDASAKSPGEIVGLDFDPILASQIDPQKYTAEKVTSKGKSFFVDVYAFIDGKKETKVTVQPELIQVEGKWQFVNFHYKADSPPDDLLHVLKVLRNDRQTYKKGASMAKQLRHVVCFKFRDDVAAADQEKVVKEFCALPQKIPSVVALEWGTNSSPEKLNKGLTHCFILTFASEKDRDGYLVNPAHLEFVKLIKEFTDDAMVLDFWQMNSKS
jgi:hypothetical protein